MLEVGFLALDRVVQAAGAPLLMSAATTEATGSGEAKGGRTVSYDREDHKGRNVVERRFNEDKQ